MLLTAKERQARRVSQRQHVLDFLKHEIYTDQAILSQVMGIQTRSGFHKAITKLLNEAVVKRHDFPILGYRKKILYGITPNGLGHSLSENDQILPTRYFEPSKISPYGIEHHLSLQRLRLAITNQPIEWVRGEQLGKLEVGVKRPDAVIIANGKQTAIEYERSFKTLKRYEEVMASYLVLRKKGVYEQVIYVCPDAVFCQRLKQFFEKIERVLVFGRRETLRPEHYQFFTFCTAENWLSVATDRIYL